MSYGQKLPLLELLWEVDPTYAAICLFLWFDLLHGEHACLGAWAIIWVSG